MCMQASELGDQAKGAAQQTKDKVRKRQWAHLKCQSASLHGTIAFVEVNSAQRTLQLLSFLPVHHIMIACTKWIMQAEFIADGPYVVTTIHPTRRAFIWLLLFKQKAHKSARLSWRWLHCI